ncbi:MAG: DNRLRE domain-containing protein [Candidatus Phytoplasma sp.]|nr:DNRLRE domain-containing protein [Phytoplasma sp.]
MKKFFNKRSKKVVDNAIKALVFLQKPFAMFGLFLILMGAFFAPAVSAYNVWSNSEKMISQIEETKSPETLPTQLYDDIDASMIPISKEIENLREENQKVFLKKDGTYEVSIYQDPVHYKSNDQYIDIDNTLVDDGKYYTNKQNAFNIYFPKSLTRNESIKIKSENYQIQWKIVNSKQSKANQSKQKKKDKDLTILNHLSSEIKYQKVFENTDLEYVLKSNQIKENLYLSQYNENIVYSFEYELKNLTIAKKDDTYSFVNDLGEEIFHLDNLYMIDSQGEISYEVKIDVERKAHNKYIIKIIPDDTFLKTASYPVKIDPTLILSRQTPVIEDTYVSENHKTTNYSNQSIMKVGYEKAVTTRKDILIKFSIPSFIKSSDVITYSHLNLSRVDKVSSNHQINVYRNITNYTNSTVNWNTKPLYNKEIIDYYDFRYVDTPLVFDISRPTKEWHENGSNFGLTIAPESHHNSVINIYQSQASYEVRPVVRIGYETKGGLKNYWTYTSQELGQAGTGYVSDFTGNLVFKRDEYFVQNEYLPLNLSFYHNGINGYSTIGYGYGYKTNYNYVILYDSNLNQYYPDTPDGNKVYFSLFSSDQSEYPYQWDDTLQKMAVDGGCIKSFITGN